MSGEKRCELCGSNIAGLGRRKYCVSCAEQRHKAMMPQYKKEYRLRKKAKELEERGRSLESKIATAKSLGISYGQLQKMKTLAQIERVRI